VTLNSLPLGFDGKHYSIRGADYETTFGLIAFLDALGVKEIWKTKDATKVLEDWKKVYFMFSDELDRLSGINLSTFSDTVIISMRGHTNLNKQPWRFIEMFCRAIVPAFVRSMDYDFFFRGVIAMGSFSRSVGSARMLIGPAEDEAAGLYEAADWIGISLSPCTRVFMENSRIHPESNFIVDYHIPQKKGTSMTWAVNWTDFDPNRKCWDVLGRKANTYAP
jgi:hypothetical protein